MTTISDLEKEIKLLKERNKKVEADKAMKICVLYLTCANDNEADKISEILLKKKLIVCAKRFPVSSSFLWEGKIDKTKEVMLVMDSIEENFNKIEEEVAKIHSYKTFVLLSSPLTKTTAKVSRWMKKKLC